MSNHLALRIGSVAATVAASLGLASGQTETWRTFFSTALITQVNACSPAPGNGIFALGSQGIDTGRILRLDAAGSVLWSRTVQYGVFDVQLEPLAIATTATGGCAIVGSRTLLTPAPRNGWIHVLDASGGLVWSLFDPDPFYVYPTAVATGPAGEVFVGYVEAQGVKKFSATGTELWVVSTPIVLGMAADGAGGVFVCGFTDDPQPQLIEAWVAHFDGAGNELYSDTFGTSTYDRATCIAADGAGGFYVAGDSWGSFGGTPAAGTGCWLQRRNAAGTVLWSRTFGSPGGDVAEGVALDSYGGAIVAGNTAGGNVTAPNPNAAYDSWVTRFDPTGALVWGAAITSPVSDRIYGLAVAASGAVYVGGHIDSQSTAFVSRFENEPLPFIGTRYCNPAVPNSTGVPTRIGAFGSAYLGLSEVRLSADSLPAQAFGYFLTSLTQGQVANPAGSQGVLCLGGAIGRYVGPGQIQNAGASGTFRLLLDLAQHPTPTGFVQVQAGQTWNFQCWHRDSVGGSATSNFSDAVALRFN